jgi:hypothetical protein
MWPRHSIALTLTIDFDSLWSMIFPNLRALYLQNADETGPEVRVLMFSLAMMTNNAWAGVISRTQRRKMMIGDFFTHHTTLEDICFTFSRGQHVYDWFPDHLDDDCLLNLKKFSGSYLIFMRLIVNGVTLSPLGTTLRTLELYDLNLTLENGWPGMATSRNQLFVTLTTNHATLKKKRIDRQPSDAHGSGCKPFLSGLETLDLVTLEPHQLPSDRLQELLSELDVWSICCGDTLRTLKIPFILEVLDPHALCRI